MYAGVSIECSKICLSIRLAAEEGGRIHQQNEVKRRRAAALKLFITGNNNRPS